MFGIGNMPNGGSNKSYDADFLMSLTVPEPTTFALLAIGLFSLLKRRARVA